MDDDGRRPSLTPQLALRVAIVGGIALVAFGVVFFRLWYLQVLSGDKYRAEANDNRVREIKVQAPRGEIVDRNGKVLVNNRTGLAVRVTPKTLPAKPEDRRDVYRRLGRVLNLSAARIERRVDRQLKALPYSPATIKQDVPQATVYFLFENQEDFPGVTVEQEFLREYPHKQVGAQLFGFVREATKEQLEDKQRYRGVGLGDRVGQSGIESQYDRFLRGRNGASRVQVDALGNLRGQLRNRRPEQGRQLRLSLDLGVQQAGQDALGGARGAFAVMNVRDGQVLALGSSPSFDPNQFSKVLPQSDVQAPDLEGERRAADQPRHLGGLSHRLHLQARSPPPRRSQGGLITPDTVQYDGGSLQIGAAGVQERRRRGERPDRAAQGAVGVQRRVLLPPRPGGQRQGQRAADPGLGQQASAWAGAPASTCRARTRG